ncbi:SCO2583/SCO2584 N-terminal domain-containing protein [Kitasatospora sp. NPDC004240]
MPIAEDPQPRPSEGGEPGGSDPSGPGGKDPFADLVLDDDFIRGASVKEQTARTRMLSARWKHTPPVDPGGRRSVNDGPKPKRFARKPRPVDPWGNPRPRRRFEWRTPLFVALAIALVLAALNVDQLRNWTGRDGSDSSSRRSAPVVTEAPETARPTTAPPQVDPKQPTVAHPWAGSPAEGWPTGAEAFVLPQAQAIGTFSAEEVAAQLRLVKDYLTAANLDPKVIAGGRPEAALAMLGTEERAVVTAALAAPSEKSDPTNWFSRFDPRDAIPATEVVKVQGSMRIESDGERGVRVHTDFTYVYALRPGPEAAKRAAAPKPSASRPAAPAAATDGAVKPVGLVTTVADVPGDTWTARTIVRRTETFRFYDPAKYRVDPKKIVFEQSLSRSSNSECGTTDGFYHPQFDQFAPTAPNPGQTGPTRDPYDRSKDLPEGEDCGTASRS